ncbi:hypothetical protein [Amphritea balenae]|uniref:Uncharacterized protein n=1 Tax=Amphritea balenae TaxID=452629 RepID=A0A3P1SL79_9GAMM|nr:hypothetical protein [Amphritea balenae]RRC98013.1 hypothetical protein EHS89_15670 [Amphritea balenae]GGK66776.1 hypothetical protein GCM10007941_16110 [Amphritea balenae]
MEKDTETSTQPTVSFSELPKETQDLVRKAQLKHKISEQYHQQYFGDTPSVNGVHVYGRMLVSVRGNIYQSNDPDFDWETPADFLVSYLKSSFGDLWLEEELAKDYREMHEVAKWYTKGVPNLEENASDRWGKPNGKALSLLHLAYDLFVLESVDQLPDFILNRLRNKQNFNGSRYELFVFATLIRAGFTLEHSDEKSGKNGRVPECLAIHTETNQKVYIEAKTRNVKNVLGSSQGKSKKIRLYDKLKDAMQKNVDGPYLIFVDVNHPNMKAEKGHREFEKLRSEYRKLEKSHKESMPNLVCFTNIPFHYGANGTSPGSNMIGFMIPRYPKYKMLNKVLQELDSSLNKYDYLPKEFQESSEHADRILDNVKA